jgi:hypothetical protein
MKSPNRFLDSNPISPKNSFLFVHRAGFNVVTDSTRLLQ